MRPLILALLAAALLPAQENPVQFSLSTEPPAAKAAPGQAVRLRLDAAIEKGWHLYSITSPVVPTATKITLPADSPLEITRLLQLKVEAKYDPAAASTTESYEDKATFLIDAKVKQDAPPGAAEITLQLRSSACNDRICLPPKRRTFTTTVTIDPAAPATEIAPIPEGFVDAAAPATPKPSVPRPAQQESLAAFLLVAFGFGLAAIFTPCVFPMIPFTLSYFLNRENATRADGIRQALVFCLGIVFLFTAIGLATSALLGPFGAAQLSANPWVNAAIALVFFGFGLSMLGAFELTLPSGLLTKMNQASEGGGYLGSLLMGLTFSLTSFACVGPFMGSLLAASVQGGKLQPALGMASFATGLASPFFLLALFPAWLKKMPKSGGWLMRVKVVLGFLVLALSIKYLSNIDQVLQLEILTRERFLAFWIVLFALPGCYLLGWLRFEGIKADEDVSIPRLLLGVLFLAFSLFLWSGLQGAPLGEIDAYVPLSTNPGSSSNAAQNLPWMKNQYQAALQKAKEENKPVFIAFTGYACTNCHWMKANMFTRPEIAAALANFVLVELYTDGTDSESEANQKFQEETFKTVAIPLYVILSPDGTFQRSSAGLTRDPAQYLSFLNRDGR